MANAELILRNDARWRGVLAYNEFSASVIFRKEPGGEAWAGLGKRIGKAWQDVDSTRLSTWFATTYQLMLRPEQMDRVVTLVAHLQSFHPVQAELRKLVWDGTPRLDTWLIRLAGSPDNPYTRAVSSKWLISAVARIFRPGCQADHVLILEGKQGKGKSSAARILAGKPDRFLEGLRDMDVEGAKTLRGKVIVELPELDAVGKSRVTQMRAFVATKLDTYRDSYGRHPRDFPRQCVFIGTVNPPYDYAEDVERRFWPVRVGKVNTIALSAERDQLWAEARVRYENGEAWHLQDPTLIKRATQEQAARKKDHPWDDRIRVYLAKNVKRNKNGISPEELFEHLGVDPGGGPRSGWTTLNRILTSLGWTRSRVRAIPGRPRFWFPPKTPKSS